MNSMSRETALQLVKEKRRIDLFQKYHQSPFRLIFIMGIVASIILSVSYSIFLSLLLTTPIIGIYFFERYWVKKKKAPGSLYFFSVINNCIEDSWKFPLAYTIQDMNPPGTNRGSYIFLLGDPDWRLLSKRSWERLFLHDGYAPHKAWQDYTVEQSVVLESGQATTIKFTFHFELVKSELMSFFLKEAFSLGLASFRERILFVLKGQVHQAIGSFSQFEDRQFKDTQDLFEKVQDRFDASFSEDEIKKRLARSGLPINIVLTHRHFEFQVCDYRAHGSRYKLWEPPNAKD